MFVLNIFYFFIIIFAGIGWKYMIPGFRRYDRLMLDLLYFFHLLCGIFFYLYFSQKGGDAVDYWSAGSLMSLDEILNTSRGKGAIAIRVICFFPANVLKMNMFVGSVLFCTIGYGGFLYLYKIIVTYMPDRSVLYKSRLFGVQLFPLILFFPNLNIWCSGIGKDSVQMFCVFYLIYAFLSLRKKWIPFTLVFILMLAIRPHVALMLGLAFTIAYILDRKSNLYLKAGLTVFASVAGIVAINYISSFLNIKADDLSAISEYATQKSETLMVGGTGIDMSSYPMPLKMFTFLFRPLFFDATNVLGLIISAEDLFVLIMFARAILGSFIFTWRRSDFVIKGIFLFILIGAILFPLFQGGNLMLLVRQRTPFTAALMLFCLYAFYCRKYSYTQSILRVNKLIISNS